MDDVMDLPRSVPLAGASNVRDLGGWPTADGRRVRFGVAYRGAALAGLTDADIATLRGAGIRTVCDFRGADERERWPSRLAAVDGVAVHDLGIEPTVGASLRDILAMGAATGQDTMAVLRAAYVSYVTDWAHRYRAVFDLLVEGRTPLLFNCTAGKDRTGVAAALILTALGVPWDAVRADYLATNRLWQPDPLVVGRFPPAVADALLRAHAELLDDTFAAIRQTHGSVDAYLEGTLGLTPPRRVALAAALLE